MRFRETKGLARHHREASGAGMRRQSRHSKPLPKCHVAECLLTEGHADPHRLRDGTRVFGEPSSLRDGVKP